MEGGIGDDFTTFKPMRETEMKAEGDYGTWGGHARLSSEDAKQASDEYSRPSDLHANLIETKPAQQIFDDSEDEQLLEPAPTAVGKKVSTKFTPASEAECKNPFCDDKKGHRIADCTAIDQYGVVNGCPWDNKNHHWWLCPNLPRVNLARLFYYLVTRRNGKPQIRSRDNLWDIFREKWRESQARPQTMEYAVNRAEWRGRHQTIGKVAKDPSWSSGEEYVDQYRLEDSVDFTEVIFLKLKMCQAQSASSGPSVSQTSGPLVVIPTGPRNPTIPAPGASIAPASQQNSASRGRSGYHGRGGNTSQPVGRGDATGLGHQTQPVVPAAPASSPQFQLSAVSPENLDFLMHNPEVLRALLTTETRPVAPIPVPPVQNQGSRHNEQGNDVAPASQQVEQRQQQHRDRRRGK